jgi:hypothetical protein
VRSADGVELGKVRRVEDETRSHIFDGIMMDTPIGRRFLDAPEVAHIAERAVTTTFPAAEADQHLVAMGSAWPSAHRTRRPRAAPSAGAAACARSGTGASLEAIARDALGEPEAAEGALERSLDLAEPEGLLIPFLLHPATGLLDRRSRRPP